MGSKGALFRQLQKVGEVLQLLPDANTGQNKTANDTSIGHSQLRGATEKGNRKGRPGKDQMPGMVAQEGSVPQTRASRRHMADSLRPGQRLAANLFKGSLLCVSLPLAGCVIQHAFLKGSAIGPSLVASALALGCWPANVSGLGLVLPLGASKYPDLPHLPVHPPHTLSPFRAICFVLTWWTCLKERTESCVWPTCGRPS
eukprot:scaffold85171_cov20-Tisochrysis_lutea.AAC.6